MFWSRLLLLLSILWLLFSIIHELVTGKFWFWVLPGLAPPIIFLAVPLFILIIGLGIYQNRLTICALALLSLLISFQSNGLNLRVLYIDPVEENRGTPIRIVQMNTDYWGQVRTGVLTDLRNKDEMLQFLNTLDADIYLLQEHMSRDGDFAPPVVDLTDVEQVFPEYEVITAGTLLTLTRLPVVSSIVVNEHNEAEIYLPPPPYVLRVDVKVGDQILSTYNVHMPIQIIIEQNWFSREFYFEIWRRHHIRRNEYQKLLENVDHNQSPLIIAGDFNTSPTMGDNRSIINSTQDATDYGNRIYPSTWRFGGQLPLLWRNDWFFLKNGIDVTNFESINPDGNSDHLVQITSIYLN